ncbi:hypothetical protein ACIBJI_32780 [Nocardia sp. NPDC050408]|uniref:hypothetical protein n=1 Tax=Nocardia sp. NPDC050408 TaxID=3364319 RepID=UPI0037BDC7E1
MPDVDHYPGNLTMNADLDVWQRRQINGVTLHIVHAGTPIGDCVLRCNAKDPWHMATDLGSGLERIGWAPTRRDWRHLVHESLFRTLSTRYEQRPSHWQRDTVLDALMLFQMVGYALLDFQDEFTIREVTFFNARDGHPAAGTPGALGLSVGASGRFTHSQKRIRTLPGQLLIACSGSCEYRWAG